MNRSHARLSLALLVPLALASASPALAYTGDDPVLATGIASCQYTDINARIDQFGHASYRFYGYCPGAGAVSGQAAWRDGKFNESFIVNGARLSTLGFCDTDPWSTAVNCHDQKVMSTAIPFDPSLLNSAPLTLHGGYNGEFRKAYLAASRPNPPGLPVNFTATAGFGSVTAHWLAPDTSGDRPFVGFLLQARPQHADGAAWTDLGLVFAHAQTDYALTRKLPPTSAAIPAWDVRLCSTTNLSSTCTPALSPESSLAKFDSRKADNSAYSSLANNRIAAAAAQATEATSDRAVVAAVAAPAPPRIGFGRVAPPPKALGRQQPAGPRDPDKTMCDYARSAKARNSPAAPALEQRCLAGGGSMTPPPAMPAALPPVDAIAAPEPPEAAEAPPMPAPAPAAAPDLDALAAVGAAIAAQDAAVAAARGAEPGAFYKVGFDIASGLFGDPALGAAGNARMDPATDAIRDSLSAAGQRGFSASTALHLARDYAL